MTKIYQLMNAEETYAVYDDCPFKGTIDEWDDDDGGIIALLCEGCPDRDECSENDYVRGDE